MALAFLFGTSACEDDEQPVTEVRVEITSQVEVDALEIRIRDRNYRWDETQAELDRDIRDEPYRLQLTPGLIDGEFLIYVRGFSDGSFVAGESATLSYEAARVVEATITLRVDFVTADADEDGFVRCTFGSDIARCDCDDRAPVINPFSAEICGDNIDNDCSGGYPPDDAGCPCTEDLPCTNLDEEFIGLAGTGACTLGVLRCVDGTLSDTCEGASPIRNPADSPEIDNNFIDDDCDGAVDEGSRCDPALFPTGRVCHRGFVDDDANRGVAPVFSELLSGIEEPGRQASFLARGECLPGTVAPGRQLCDAATGTWASSCDGDVLPQRPPSPEQLRDIQRGDTVDPASFAGVGFVELRLSGVADLDGNPIDQCDGLDNNCDGSFDEANAFDSDDDGYTRCGTPVTLIPADGDTPRIELREVGGLIDSFIDCNDQDAEVFPRIAGINEPAEFADTCGERIDNDCLCDHGGEDVVGLPRFRVDGTANCAATQAFLDCSLTGARSDPTEPGLCADPATGDVYYWGYRLNQAGVKACFACPAAFGAVCDVDTGACSTREGGCCPCPSTPIPSDPDSFDPSQLRPLCGDSVPGSCNCTTAAMWAPLEEGMDTFDDCSGYGCEAFYWGTENGECFRVRNATSDDVACAGLDYCEEGQTDGCCDPSDPASCCQGPEVVCAGFVPPSPGASADAGFRGTADPGRGLCQITTSGCFAQTPPSYAAQAVGTDAFGECRESFTCSDEDNDPFYFGITRVADEPTRCYLKSDVNGNDDHHCDGSGACQTREQACAFISRIGDPVERGPGRVCRVPTDGCTGADEPVYGQDVPFRTDPYNDCPGAGNCCNGQCCAQLGGACSNSNDCDAGLSCVDGVCCDGACNSPCEACRGDLTGLADGTCGPIESVVVDTVPSSNLCSGAGGCLDPPCICDGNGNCRGDLGSSCSSNSECGLGFCVDGVCCESACETGCFACLGALTGASDGQCRALASAGPDVNPTNACAGNSGCGAGGTGCSCVAGTGECRRAQGSVCTSGSQCQNGRCFDGFCCDQECDEACEACSAALSTSTSNGVCAELAAFGPDTSPTTTCGGSTGCSGSDCVCQPGTGNCLDRAGSCSVNTDCPSGICVEGQCCDRACDGLCESCVSTLTGVESGTCAPIANGPDTQPSALCSGNDGCSGNACTCVGGTCSGALGSSCSNGSDCHSNQCVDGVCCETACEGTCQACSSSLTGESNGLCRNISSNVDDTEPSDLCVGTNTCRAGTGECRRDTGQSCSANSECLTGFCRDGFCCESACDTACRGCSAALTGGANGQCEPLSSGGPDTSPSDLCVGGTGCPGGVSCECEAGSGMCKNRNGVACSSNGECLSGNCADGFCCNNACNGSCNACDLAGSEGTCGNSTRGTAGDPACSDGLLCDGSGSGCPSGCGGDDALCAGGFFCDGNVCRAEQGVGAACGADAECISGFCVEGVCCDRRCGGPCESCLASRKESGGNGLCGIVSDGAEGAPECADNLRCDGSNASCPTSCNGEPDCDSGFGCLSGVCVAKIADGGACSMGSECSSGHCVDGVCCENDCGGVCDACSSALKGGGPENGECRAIAAGTDPDGECGRYFCVGGPGAAGSNCDTTCESNDDSQCKTSSFCDAGSGDDQCVADLGAGESCENPGDCSSGFCVDGVCCQSACNGTCEACSAGLTGESDGTCAAVTSGTDPADECGAYQCGNRNCRNDCEGDLDSLCKPGFYCNEVSGNSNDRCLPLEDGGGSCDRDTDCISGSCTSNVCDS
ncbi:MAG: MopE-related protein [Myxococcota bacterium]